MTGEILVDPETERLYVVTASGGVRPLVYSRTPDNRQEQVPPERLAPVTLRRQR